MRQLGFRPGLQRTRYRIYTFCVFYRQSNGARTSRNIDTIFEQWNPTCPCVCLFQFFPSQTRTLVYLLLLFPRACKRAILEHLTITRFLIHQEFCLTISEAYVMHTPNHRCKIRRDQNTVNFLSHSLTIQKTAAFSKRMQVRLAWRCHAAATRNVLATINCLYNIRGSF